MGEGRAGLPCVVPKACLLCTTRLVGNTVTIEASGSVVSIYHHNQLVTQHAKSAKEGGFSTQKEHMPDSHVKQRTADAYYWAENIGVGTCSGAVGTSIVANIP